MPNNMICVLLSSLFLIIGHATQAEENSVTITIETEFGAIEANLYPDRAPITVANFLRNIDAGLYKNGLFYRVLTQDPSPFGALSLIQGGQNMEMAKRAPIEHETTATSGLSHTDGVLSMARLAPGTATSHFFICIGDNTGLDYSRAKGDSVERPGYAAFGQVTKGMEVVRKIQRHPFGHRDANDPLVVAVRKDLGAKIAGELIPSLLDNSIGMRIRRVQLSNGERL